MYTACGYKDVPMFDVDVGLDEERRNFQNVLKARIVKKNWYAERDVRPRNRFKRQ